MSGFLATYETGDSVSASDVFAGSEDISTAEGKLVSGQNLAAYTVLGRLTASGKFTQWAPAASDGSQIAVAILVHATDATSVDKLCQVYTAGAFNIDKLVWPSTTTVNKVKAFDGTAIKTVALSGSTTAI